jgi:G protein-coupled receptor GPR1
MAETEVDELDRHPSYRVLILRCISLSFASLSVLSTFFAFYWFVKMRRSFRQECVPVLQLLESDPIRSDQEFTNTFR